jgi:hypothetical protein
MQPQQTKLCFNAATIAIIKIKCSRREKVTLLYFTVFLGHQRILLGW